MIPFSAAIKLDTTLLCVLAFFMFGMVQANGTIYVVLGGNELCNKQDIIHNETECAFAARSIGKSFYKSKTSAANPIGCYLETIWGRVLFNKHPVGNRKENNAPICRKDAYSSLGCWKDTGNRAIPTIEGKNSLLDGSYRSREDAIHKCYEAAKSFGHNVFAVQHGGWCASSATAISTYQKYGQSTACLSDGKGGPWANEVYRIDQGRQCVQIANTACLNWLNANHHPEVSAYNCMEACREDVACTGGFHFHTSFDPARITDTCHMFGVKGAIDKKCIGRTIWLESTGFICN